MLEKGFKNEEDLIKYDQGLEDIEWNNREKRKPIKNPIDLTLTKKRKRKRFGFWILVAGCCVVVVFFAWFLLLLIV